MENGRFHKGQRVRVVKCYRYPEDFGKIVVITTDYEPILGGPEWGYFTNTGRWGEDHQFAPLDDLQLFSKFMDRVLEPRPELQGLPTITFV